MRKILIGILLVLLSQVSIAQSDWTHVKVKQTNLANRFITTEGKTQLISADALTGAYRKRVK